jgi:LmbE family N-acetylglucosaminyl deacetylase
MVGISGMTGTTQSVRLLVAMAHPDDAEIFIWGSLSAWHNAGAQIQLVVATSGEGGVRQGHDIPNLALHREQEALNAAATLDIVPQFMRLPDGGLPDAHHLTQALKERIEAFKPDIVITHAPGDYHADHRALAASVQSAGSFTTPVLFCDPLGGVGFEPNIYVDVTSHREAKAAAIRCHASQDPERFVLRADLQNQWRAFQCNGGLDHRAEAFRFEPRYPFTDIRSLLPPAPAVKRL